MRIIECKVWCTANDAKLIDLGMDEGDQWMPIAIDLDRVCAVKLAGENEFLGNDKATLYFEHVTTDIKFTDAIKLWKEC